MQQQTERIEGAWRREKPRILAWLKGRVQEDMAEDILQDVLIGAFTNLDALEPVRDLGAWLWRGVRNRLIDGWRSHRRREEAGEVDLEDFDAIVDEALLSAQDELERQRILDELEAAIDALPPGQAEVIRAQALYGESFASISERSGVSIEALAARKRRAIASLGARLGARTDRRKE